MTDWCKEAAAEIERLRERLGPHGLEVVLIDGSGHYVNTKVKDEIERLRELFRIDGEQYAAHIKGLSEQYDTRLSVYAAEIKKLRAALGQIKWKCIDLDNMEFQATITAWQMDAIRALKEQT